MEGMRGRRCTLAVALCLFILRPASLLSQFDMMIFQSRAPQAQSRREINAFLDMLEVAQPDKTIELVTRFVEQFPKSEFLGQVHRMEMQAYKELNDAKRAIAAGEKSVELNPHDVDALLTLAVVLPYGITDSAGSRTLLDKAEVYARRALDEVSTLKAARSVPLEEWVRITDRMKAMAHEALGTVAFERGEYAESVKEFELSTGLNPVEEGPQYYRLGLAYLFNGRLPQAQDALQRASRLGPEIVKAQAEAQLAALARKSH